jgi:tRNA(fMet)-specific endonuclease VapC
MIYLLDTNVCVEFLRNRNSYVRDRLTAIDRSQVAVCAPVVAELLFGAYRSQRPHENTILVQELCATMVSLPFDDDAAYASSSLSIF